MSKINKNTSDKSIKNAHTNNHDNQILDINKVDQKAQESTEDIDDMEFVSVISDIYTADENSIYKGFDLQQMCGMISRDLAEFEAREYLTSMSYTGIDDLEG